MQKQLKWQMIWYAVDKGSEKPIRGLCAPNLLHIYIEFNLWWGASNKTGAILK